MTKARTIAEGYAYLELTLPDGESWVDYQRHTTLRTVDDDTWLLRYDGPYEGEPVVAEVAVGKASHEAAERAGQPYGLGRSSLLDAGQWYLIEAASAGLARAGMDRLVAGPPDEQVRRTVADAWANAAGAAAEIEKFLPPGGAEVPAEAFWTELGRRVHRQRRDAFRRTRTAGDRAYYLRQIQQLPASEQVVDPEVQPGPSDQPGPPEREAFVPAPRSPVDGPVSAPLPARSYAEAYVYLDGHPCECGSADFPRSVVDVLRADEREFVARYAGPCDRCARPREFTFRLPQRPALPPDGPYRFGYPTDGPSELLDPGDWVAVAEAYAGIAAAVRAELPAGPPPDRAGREAVATLLETAVGALDEVFRFLPPGADAVPVSAFWTATGWEMRQLAPDRFARTWLTEQRAELLRRIEEVTAGHAR